MAALRTPVAKIPLAARKNLRDVWEAQKPTLEAKISDLLGTPWTVEINPNALYAYASDWSADQLGAAILGYIEGLIWHLSRFVDSFGPAGPADLNALASNHRVTIIPDATASITYNGCAIGAGDLQLVFAPDNFAVNLNDAASDLHLAIKAVPPPPGQVMNLVARNAIRLDYDPKIPAIHTELAALLNIPPQKLIFNPDWEANYTAVLKAKRDDNWMENFGMVGFGYFEGVKWHWAREVQGMEGDEMMQEGFLEVVDKKEIRLRVVEELVTGTYNEILVEDGVLIVQTTPRHWGTNISDPAAGLMKLL